MPSAKQELVSPDVRRLLEEFVSTLNLDWVAPPDLLDAAQITLHGCNGWSMVGHAERQRRLLALVNSKLRLNRGRFQAFLDEAASQGICLNYHDKAEALDCLDNGLDVNLHRWLNTRASKSSGLFRPLSQNETLAALHEQLRTGFVLRKDAKQCGVAERRNQVLRSLFGSFIFHSFPAEAMHKHFNPDSCKKYFSDFYQHLLHFHAQVLNRDCALIYLRVGEQFRKGLSATQLRDALYGFIGKAYERLANHCFLAILIEPFQEGAEDGQWGLFSDLILYAEKHNEIPLKIGYFHADKIRQDTIKYIPQLDQEPAKFEMANEGFFFRDCFVLATGAANGQIHTTSTAADLLILFEKNERDETIIPCPGCRSRNIAGNSYPSLGVRSWECQNPICPDRSAFDRGNRYSLSSLIKQEAIKSDEDQIPEQSLKKWKLDVVPVVDEKDVTEMLLRHFSLHGDRVVFVNSQVAVKQMHGRRVLCEIFESNPLEVGRYEQFQQSCFFKRFVVDRVAAKSSIQRFPNLSPEIEIYEGDCFDVLCAMPECCIDGAVTSPPYYNARSYAQWANIYCYLYDMYNSARQVFRVLKPGALYLFNIFDYFDNENNLVFSAMGKKRMILGAYIVNLFRRVGFEIRGNVVWYKGEIEGKRNFNQGNRSPYYQFPFNCWEHVLVFRKPGSELRSLSLPTILAAKPVIKMVRGENVLGHSAPFPPAIPELLFSGLQPGERVLDPFSGSMTTGRAAYRCGLSSVSIEMHREYCDLGLRLLARDMLNNLDLFAGPVDRDAGEAQEQAGAGVTD